jgi:FtsZ-binding cell division protein ZapB
VPDYTCPDIDFIVDKVENNNKGFTKFRKKLIVKKLERLRVQNEQLRDSGKYWYKKLKSYLIEFLD